MGETISNGDREVTLLDYLIVILKRKRLILSGAVFLTLLALLACLVMTPSYEVVTRLMPPQDNSSGAAAQIMAQAGMALGVSSSLLGAESASDLYAGLLQTEAILDPVINRFGLVPYYDCGTLEKTREKILDDVLKVETDSKSGIISLTVYHANAEKGAQIANSFIEELRNLLTRIAVTDAGKRRIFLETQLKQAYENLKNSEDAFQTFQEATGAIKMDDQAAATLQQIVSLRALVLSKESQLNVMKTYATGNNPDFKRALSELRTLKEELERLEESTGQKQAGGDIVIPTSQIPTLGKEYIRQLRDFKLNELMWEMIVKQYEAARLDEARESLTVQVICEAKPPSVPARPKTGLIAAIAGATGLFLFTFLAFLIEFVERTSEGNADDKARIREVKRLFWRF